MITSIPRNSNWPYPSTPPSACQCLQQNRPVTAHAGSTHAIPRNATEFLDGCSGIDPDIDDNPNLAQTTLEHAPDASFYFFTVGRLKTIDDIKHMVLALPAPQPAWCFKPQPANRAPSNATPTSPWQSWETSTTSP